ncbi:MAG: hypothetical protein KAJ19_11560, partial [Gammaproteobacteria bacterium]|nr:hypothetical protein [Gammaproteobacteria bacterium]
MIDVDVVVLQLGERLRALATKKGRIPFLSGDLRKSVQVDLVAKGEATVGSGLSYARAVHDGRPPITIVPNLTKNPRKNPKRARLKFALSNGQIVFARKVRQPARKGQPFLIEAAREMKQDGYDFLNDYLLSV